MTSKSKKAIASSRRGQTSVEYILIIAVVVGVIFAFGNQFKSKITDITNQLFGNVGKSIDSLSGGGK